MLRMIFTDPTGNYDMPGDSLANELINLISRAKSSIDIHGYELTEFFNKDLVLYHALRDRLEFGVTLSIYGDKKSQIEEINTDMFRKHQGGFRDQVHYFFYKKPKIATGKSLYHPKAIVVDERLMYLGSANISQNAMKNSVEIGAIIEDTGQCKELKKFVNYLIKEKMLIPLSNYG